MVIVKVKDRAQLQILIAKKGKSIRGFSRDIGISHSYLSQILNGIKTPSPKIAKKIADGLEESMSTFFLIKVVDELPIEEVAK